MLLNLSKKEILALKYINLKSPSPSDLANLLNVKKSFVSRILKNLDKKGLLLTVVLRKKKTLNLSLAPHAQAFGKLYRSRPNAEVESWLSGKTMGVLVLASQNGITSHLLHKEAGCSKPTIYKILKSLYSVGVAAKYADVIKVTDPLVKDFANLYADNLQLILQKEVKGINTSIRVRKHVVLRTDSLETPSFFSKTGVNALAEQGLDAILTSYNDFYFNLDENKRELTTEEAFIHALLLTTLQQHQDRPILALFYSKNRQKLNLTLLRDLARTYHVESEFDEVRRGVGYYEKLRGIA